jgi:2,4-dienoyl-CoA reductase (NADPH2)
VIDVARRRTYDTLLSPVRIGTLTVPNRVAKAPQDTHFVGPDGRVEERVLALYEALARGGVGLVFLASVPPIPMAPEAQQIAIWDDEFIPGLGEVVRRVQRHGSRIFVQLNHGGPAEVDHFPSGRAWAPSTLEVEELPSPPPHFKPVRGLSRDEIHWVEEQYVEAAERARRAGFDGVEVHAAHTYMLGSFLSRLWNKRDDEYGVQTIENRTRIVANVLAGIRERLGADYPVGVRINGQEWGADGALTIEESVENARALEAAGAQYVSVSGYGHGPVPFKYVPDYWRYPEPRDDMKRYLRPPYRGELLRPATAAIRDAVSVPVIAVGRIRPEKGEEMLRQGQADLIAMGRSLWADHDLVNKLAEGRWEDVRPCTFCATCEVSPRRCRVNAALGSVDDYELSPAPRSKRVMVVGGGPAGMEAARVAAARGHRVTLYEKDRRLGGLLPLAVMVKGTETEDILALRSYLERQMDRLGVEVRRGVSVTPATVAEHRPDVLIWAAGGKYRLPEIPGIDHPSVLTAEQLRRRVGLPLRYLGPRLLRRLTAAYLPIGRRVVVVGGRIEGVETAEFLLKRRRDVTIVDTEQELGEGMPGRLLMRVLHWLDEERVPIHTGVQQYVGIDDTGLTLVDADGAERTIEADSIVVALPQVPDDRLDLEGAAPEVHVVGPRRDGTSWLIVDAIAAGFRAGCAV